MPIDKLAGSMIIVIFALLGLLHAYWGLGGKCPVEAAVPHINGKPRFLPNKVAIWLVVIVVIVGILIVLGRLDIWDTNIPPRIFKWGTWTIFGVFVMRSIGNFWFYGLFKRVNDTKFACWDTRLYVPFCLLMAALTLIVAI